MKDKSRKILFLFSLFFISSLLFLAGCSENKDADAVSNSSVEVDQSGQEELVCPKGNSHEPAPGSCPLYRDENNDGFCDFG